MAPIEHLFIFLQPTMSLSRSVTQTGFSGDSLYPLTNATNEDLAAICEVLWGWSPCLEWTQKTKCQAVQACPCARAARLGPFFDFYRTVTAHYLPDIIGTSNTALRSHKDLRDIIGLLKAQSGTPRQKLTDGYFAKRQAAGGAMPPTGDQNRAFNLAARVILMVQSTVEHQTEGLLESGVEPMTWHSERSLSEFVCSLFPKRAHQIVDEGDGLTTGSAKDPLASIMAKRLQKVAKLEIIPTDDLSNHLYLDESNGTVSIFHHTTVLKENLDATASRDGPRLDGEASHASSPGLRCVARTRSDTSESVCDEAKHGDGMTGKIFHPTWPWRPCSP
jgi:hypothetical protein